MNMILEINLSICFTGIIAMVFFITCTKNKDIRNSLIIGTIVSALCFFIRKILPYLY